VICVSCEFDAGLGRYGGVVAYDFFRIYGCYIHGDYAGSGVFASFGSGAIYYSIISGVTSYGARGVRASACELTLKHSLIDDCYEGAVADVNGSVDFTGSRVRNCSERAFRAWGGGYIEAWDCNCDSNYVVAAAFAGGEIWIDTDKVTDTTYAIFDPGGSGRVQDSVDESVHYNTWAEAVETVSTTDDTVTQIATISLVESEYLRVEADVGCRGNGSRDHAFYKIAGLFYRNDGDNVMQVGSDTPIMTPIESNIALDAGFSLDVPNQSIDIWVQGIDMQIFNWQVSYKYKKMEDPPAAAGVPE